MSELRPQTKFIEPKFTKRSEECLDIPHIMELMETMDLLELLMHTGRFPYPRGDHTTVFREIGIIKPLNKLAKLRDNWNELVGRDCIKELAKYPEHKFHINCRSTQIQRFCISLS